MGASGVNLFEREKRVAQVQKLGESQFEVANHQLLETLLLLQSLQSKVREFLSGHSILSEPADLNGQRSSVISESRMYGKNRVFATAKWKQQDSVNSLAKLFKG